MKKILSSISAIIGSHKMTLAVLIIYGILLGIATFVEKYNGTEIAQNIYYHPIVGILWILMIINWIILTLQKKISIKRHIGFYLLHTSFIFIIGGAIISHYTSMEGILHVRESEQTNEVITNKKEKIILPFQVYLNDFQLLRYPGSNSPRSYKSIITVYERNAHSKMEIYMNKVISIQGYRLFQTAYDEDEAGTILTVSHDPVGMNITYIGYFCLIIGILCLPLQRQSRIRKLLKRLQLLLLLLVMSSCYIYAQPNWDDIQVQNPNGRIEPLDTYCRTLTRKIHHKESVKGIKATEFIFDLIRRPDYWNKQPIIYQTNKEIQQELKQHGKYLCLNDLFDTQGNYLLQKEITQIYQTPTQQHSQKQKDLLKLDEKINILLALEQGKMLALFPLPDDEQQRWFSPGDDLSEFSGEDSLFVSHIMPWYISEPNQEVVDMISIYQKKKSNCPILSKSQINFEIFYNRTHPLHYSAIGYLGFGLLLLIIMLFRITHNKSSFLFQISKLAAGLICLCFIFHTTSLAIRWYIGEQAPWSNAYESMVYASWCILGASFIFIRKSLITVSLGAFFSGILLLVSNMNWMDPAITPLVPVLQSYWLMIHVAVIMGGYGFLAISFLLGITNLSLMSIPHISSTIEKQIKELTIINEISLLLGLCLMCAGTFLGAIWANEAWGRYWGWDPKETWALITIIIYTAITHAHFIAKLNNEYALNAMSIVGFGTVLMTYFGVNYYLTGMHSYGGGNAPFEIYIFIIVYILLAILCIVAFRQFSLYTSKIYNS